MVWQPIIIILIFAWLLQAALTYFQINSIQKRLRALSERGYVGLGRKKKRFGRGRIVILVCNPHKEIIHAEEMSGITVFTRFKENQELVGYKLSQLEKEDLKNETQKEAVKQAIDEIKKVFQKENSENDAQKDKKKEGQLNNNKENE